MSTPNTFEINAQPIIERAERLVLEIIDALKSIAIRLSNNPSELILINQEIARLQSNIDSYEISSKRWVDENLSDAYLRGVLSVGAGQVVAGFSFLGLLASGGGGGDISERARQVLSKYPEHWTAYRVFQNDAYNAFNQSRLPIVRDVQGKIRDLVIKASEASYRDADTYTRRQFSQQIMNELADEGITGVRYSNGRTMKIDSYAEMVARTQTKNAWNEASWNRQQEYGLDLVVMSVHYPTSPMCEPYQGGVYSLSGTSDKYPSMESAINGGAFHVNCMHTTSGYAGDKPPTPVSVERNEEMYKAQNEQRYNERQIRHWKRREAASLTPEEMKKSKQKVKQWQSKQRDHIQGNEFLRRKYSREQI